MSSDYVMKLQQAMKQQSQDLRDELEDLKNWQSSIKDKSAAVAKKHENQKKSEIFNSAAGKNIPPIRYTAPMPTAENGNSKSSTNGSSSSTKKTQDIVTECKERGNAYFQRQQFEDAVRAYTQGLDADPTSPLCSTLYGNRSLCNLRLRRWDAAEKDATSAIGLNRTNAKAFYRRALARKQLGNLDEAKSDLDTVQVLQPGDSDSAKELLIVNQMIVEKAKNENKSSSSASSSAAKTGASSSSAPKKKKLVIQEVSDEDEDEDDGISPQEQKRRDDKLRKEMEEAESRQAAERKAQAAKEEALRQRQRKTNSRVEIVDEDEDVEEPAPKINITNNSTKHQDPTASATRTSSSASPQPASPVKNTNTTTTTTTSSSSSPTAAATTKTATTATTKSKSASVPLPRNVNVQVFTKDNMPNPESFADFERVFREIEKNPELVGALAAKVASSRTEASQIAQLFGSNLTSEMFSGLLASAAERMSNTNEIGLLLKGLSQAKRIEDLVMFMEENDQKYLKAALAKSTGLSAAEKAQVEKNLS